MSSEAQIRRRWETLRIMNELKASIAEKLRKKQAPKSVKYPFVRLQLKCGCYELQTAEGATDVHICEEHLRSRRSDEFGLTSLLPLMEARQAILKHGIVTVRNGGGGVDLEGIEER